MASLPPELVARHKASLNYLHCRTYNTHGETLYGHSSVNGTTSTGTGLSYHSQAPPLAFRISNSSSGGGTGTGTGIGIGSSNHKRGRSYSPALQRPGRVVSPARSAFRLTPRRHHLRAATTVRAAGHADASPWLGSVAGSGGTR